MFKLIENVDSHTVKEHYDFIHPKYISKEKGKKTNQMLYFNNSAERMIELLNFNRINVYDKSMTNEQPNRIKWEHVKRLENFNCLFGSRCLLECVSPSFKNYIKVDLAKKRFQIQDVVDDKVSHDLPEYLMNYD